MRTSNEKKQEKLSLEEQAKLYLKLAKDLYTLMKPL